MLNEIQCLVVGFLRLVQFRLGNGPFLIQVFSFLPRVLAIFQRLSRPFKLTPGFLHPKFRLLQSMVGRFGLLNFLLVERVGLLHGRFRAGDLLHPAPRLRFFELDFRRIGRRFALAHQQILRLFIQLNQRLPLFYRISFFDVNRIQDTADFRLNVNFIPLDRSGKDVFFFFASPEEQGKGE